MRAGDGIVAELFGLAVSEWGWSIRRALDCPLGALILAVRESRRLDQPCEKRGFGWAEQDALEGENGFGLVELDEMKGRRLSPGGSKRERCRRPALRRTSS